MHQSLDSSLPPGLDVVAVVVAPPGALADALQASHWRVEIASDLAVARTAVASFLAQESITVERMTKRGLRSFDCRDAVLSLRADDAPRGSVLDLVLRHSVPAVRPDDVLAGMSSLADLCSSTLPYSRG